MSFSPYLFFVGSCREAMNTYQSIFGGELDIVTAADLPDAPPEAPKDAIMHAALTLDNGGLLMASDDPTATEDAPKTGIRVSMTAAELSSCEIALASINSHRVSLGSSAATARSRVST